MHVTHSPYSCRAQRVFIQKKFKIHSKVRQCQNILRGQDIIADISDTAVILQRLRKFCKPVQNIADWVKCYLNVHRERAGVAGHNSQNDTISYVAQYGVRGHFLQSILRNIRIKAL